MSLVQKPKPGNLLSGLLTSPAGKYVLGIIFLLFSLLFAAGIATQGIPFLLITFFVIVGLPAAYAVVAYPKLGIMIMLTLAYSISFFSSRLLGVDFPMGTLMDGVLMLMIFGFFLKQKYANDWAPFRNGISTVLLAWLFYNLLEVINPAASSRLAWVYTVRTIAVITLSYFIFVYHIRDVGFIRKLMKLWIFFSLLGALYAYKQQYLGFAGFEEAWLASDPKFTSLYFIAGEWRKFSIYTDPMTFSYNMVAAAILCFCLASGPIRTWKKATLYFLSIIFIIAMLFSGTRSAYVLIPVAFLFYSILKFDRRILMLWMIVVPAFILALIMPAYNHTIYRFQTAFKPSQDASFNLRKENQKKIQPFIQSHPIGGGLGATGVWGQRFSPNSFLANFPPDSGYVRVAVELGWVGLLLFCTLMFVILKNGINNYFRIRDPELRTYCLASVVIIFALNIGNYPQEALVQYPLNVYFYLAVAIISVTPRLDKLKHPEDETINEKLSGGKHQPKSR